MRRTTRTMERPARPGWRLLSAWLAPLTLAACASFGHVGPRPAEVAGEWVDIARSTPADTFVWLLRPSGEDSTLHLRVGGAPVSRRSGIWYASGQWSDPSRRRLCFVAHPGRSARSCAAFRLESRRVDGGVRRTLTLVRHGRPERTLLERMR